MKLDLAGRRVLITGASQGIGRACALKLATTGAAVAVAARNQDKLNELASEITAAGGKAAVFALDVTDEEQIKSAIKAAIAQFGKVDILVNNAGITRDQLVMRLKRADWIQAAISVMVARSVEQVRVERLAVDLGASKGSFYWHFKDRDDLLAAVLAFKVGIDADDRIDVGAHVRREQVLAHIFTDDLLAEFDEFVVVLRD